MAASPPRFRRWSPSIAQRQNSPGELNGLLRLRDTGVVYEQSCCR